MSESNIIPDETLLEMVRQGKQSALIRLHKQCYEGVRNHILKNSGSEEDVDDIIQDALIVFWQKAIKPEFELNSKLSTFIFGIAKFLWMNKLRKSGRELVFETLPEGGLPMWTEANSTNPDIKIVRACLDDIGETCKTLLGLFYFDGFPMDKIAEMMDLSNADTAKSKKYQCLKKLEAIIKSRYRKEDLL